MSWTVTMDPVHGCPCCPPPDECGTADVTTGPTTLHVVLTDGTNTIEFDITWVIGQGWSGSGLDPINVCGCFWVGGIDISPLCCGDYSIPCWRPGTTGAGWTSSMSTSGGGGLFSGADCDITIVSLSPVEIHGSIRYIHGDPSQCNGNPECSYNYFLNECEACEGCPPDCGPITWIATESP